MRFPQPKQLRFTLFFNLALCVLSTTTYAQVSLFTQQSLSPQISFNSLTLDTAAMNSVDQCNTTAQCKAIYGNGATDCQNSQSNMSVCICGSSRCDYSSNPNPNVDGFPGRFDPSKDLFLAFFDNRPDADDIHSQAALATMLADGRFQKLDVYSVLGAYGKQGGAFLNSTSVMNLCLGSQNWSNAHPKDGANWTASLNAVFTRVNAAFARGGNVWIMEAGQSDFSADLVRQLKSSNSSLDTQNRVHIIQHSDFNQNQTTSADLAYVRANTDYNKIPDGNSTNNGTPGFNTRNGSQWSRATSLPNGLGACWSESRRVADTNNFSGNGHYENPSIEAGGFDFSDVVEATWVFGFNGLANVGSFFAEFPQNQTPPTTPTPTTPDTGDTPAMTAIVSALLLDQENVDDTNNDSSNAFMEQNGLIVIELESLNAPAGWQRKTGDGALADYLQWAGGDNFGSPGSGLITADLRISTPGTYRFLWRNSVRRGDNPTEHNDSWLRILADNFYGLKNQNIVCPRSKPVSNRCTGALPNGSSSNGWFKIYRSGGPAGNWVWQANTSDNDGHNVYADFDRPGVYQLQISGRSNDHGIDRLVLFRSGNATNNVSASFATDPARAESAR